MRIAVSDFDGTLGDFSGVKPEVIDAIHAWRAAGHSFGVATGRSRAMLTHALDKDKIPVDFMICCNGAHICDGQRKDMQRTEIPGELLADLLHHPASEASFHCVLISGDATQAYVTSKHSWLPDSGLPYRPLSLDEAMRAGNQIQYSLSYDHAEEAMRYAADLNRCFAPTLYAHHNGHCIDVTRQGVTKATGVEKLLRLMGWEDCQVLTIGDGENDLPMILRFHGFTVPAANDQVKQVATRVYPDVGAMLRDNM